MVGLASFLVRRILLGIMVMWFVTIGTFLLFFVAPQDPARLLAGKNTTAAQIAAINRRLGLDQPLIVQYWHYLSRLVHGNLGTSYFTGE
jgi:peptide/nickel transport system permease protein